MSKKAEKTNEPAANTAPSPESVKTVETPTLKHAAKPQPVAPARKVGSLVNTRFRDAAAEIQE